MFLTNKDQQAYEKALINTPLDARIHIVLYNASDNSVYPINALRNLAIENVKTTHFWLADMDMWPSRKPLWEVWQVEGLREALMALPKDQLARSDLAVIVPAFELSKGRDCGSFETCAKR